MATKLKTQYNPDYTVHPGVILEKTLLARGMKKVIFSELVGLTDKTVSQIINGSAPITPASALQFERVLNVSSTVWNNLESRYRLYLAKVNDRLELEENIKWAKKFPLSELFKLKLIKKQKSEVESLSELLNFFGVGSIGSWKNSIENLKVEYRESPSFKGAPEAVLTWLRIGELQAEKIDTVPYNKDIFMNALQQIRMLTRKPPKIFSQSMVELCRGAGVALVFVPELKKTHLSGASRWLSPSKSLIILSLRHKKDDHFWFSFFHEAAHILKHGKKQRYLDGKIKSDSIEEQEADNFASDFLIPAAEFQSFIEAGTITGREIKRFAERFNIAPGILVGRLQHDKHIPYSNHNRLKLSLEIGESSQE